MDAWARIEQFADSHQERPKILWEGRFDIAEHDVIYAAHAVLREYFPDDDGLDPADIQMRVYPSPLNEDLGGTHLDYQNATLMISGVLVIDQLRLEAKDNPYPLAFKLLREEKLTSFSSTDDLNLNTGKPTTYFWYSCPAVQDTTGGPAETFTRYVQAMAKGWNGYDAGQIPNYLKEN